MLCHSPHSSLERPLTAGSPATAALLKAWHSGGQVAWGRACLREQAGTGFVTASCQGPVVRPGGRGLGLWRCLGKGLKVVMASLTGPGLGAQGWDLVVRDLRLEVTKGTVSEQ